jgi:peptide deformylase
VTTTSDHTGDDPQGARQVAILPIRLYGDPVLKERAAPVEVFDRALARFGADLLETMRAANGVGLAAPQVGVLRRVFAYDLGVDEDTGEHPHGVVVNPLITRAEGEQTGDEGCLSFPGLYYECTRADLVQVRAADLTGASLELTGQGLLARVFQHEIDHLDGVLFIDRLPRGERKKAMRAWRERELDLETPGAAPHLHVPAPQGAAAHGDGGDRPGSPPAL